MKFLMYVILTFPHFVFAAECDYSALIDALKVPTAAKKLHNCRLEVLQEAGTIKGHLYTIDMVYVEDARLNTNVGIDIWSQNECEYKYDRYSNTHYYYDDRLIGPVIKRRSIKFNVNKQNEIQELEIGIKDLNSWQWTSRVLCKPNHFGDDE
jgi:hypothetical protein